LLQQTAAAAAGSSSLLSLLLLLLLLLLWCTHAACGVCEQKHAWSSDSLSCELSASVSPSHTAHVYPP
jgi:hypothetical protein